MAELKDIANEFIRDEIEEFIERPDMRANSASVIFVLSNVSIIS